jgi:hypothetical protein
MPRPGGRPPQDPESIRTILVAVAVSPRELEALTIRAALVGRPLSVFLREAALGGRFARPVPPINRSAWTDLSRLAGNLSQLAFQLQRSQGIAASLEDLYKAAKLTRNLRDALCGGRAHP